MVKKNVLIVGGYGRVGSVLSETLAKESEISMTIAGRDPVKAEELAKKLGSGCCAIDVTDKSSILSAIEDMDIVINCFAGPFTHFNLFLPEIAAERGLHYLDVAGSYEYAERFLKLNDSAHDNHSILITALGANPGIPGIVFMKFKDTFDEISSCEIYFILGSSLREFSLSSLRELKFMFDVKPLVWDKNQWIEPRKKSKKVYFGKPFDKDIYVGAWLTRDMLLLPKLANVCDLSVWSGSQDSLQGLAMVMGLKLGLTKRDSSAQLLLNLLKKLGRKGSISEAFLKLEMNGNAKGVFKKLVIEMHCDESYATALAPAIVCKQICEGRITRHGAFLPPEIVPARDFVDRLSGYDIHLRTTES